MADEPQNTSDISDPVETTAKEDAETTAARRELKQTSISDKAKQNKAGQDEDQSASDEDVSLKDKAAADTADPDDITTPDTDPGDVKSGDEDMLLREQVSSPKKKRAHDELVADGSSTAGEGSSKPALDTPLAQTRTEESEPEKKRPRDRDSSMPRRRSQDAAESGESSRSSLDKTQEAKSSSAAPASKTANGVDKQPQTSASAFAASGFAKLASSSTSPFGALGSSAKPSLFGGASSSSFGSFSVLGGSKPADAAVAPSLTSAAPKLSFASSSASAPSPFALNGGKSTSLFGSPFASAFGGSASSGSGLSTFGKPGGALKSDKPAKPFGAPESDNEQGSDREDEDEVDSNSDKEKEESKDAEKEKEDKAAAEEKKKLRLQKIVVDDGESGEVTLLAVRAKMFIMEKGVGWKERGAGMLKVNVPKSTIELDEAGNVDPTTFDASVFEDEGEDGTPKSVRLIMRQDHTLRVILNTAVVPAMTFQLNQKLKAAFVLFTAFDGGEAKQVQMKLSEANATNFTQLMGLIQKQLADV